MAAGWSGSDFALARYDPDGSLDATFSSDGRQSTDFGGYDYAQTAAIQADGGIVAVGASIPSGDGGNFSDFALARYEANGSLDASFSGDGKQTTDFNVEDAGWSIAIQADGKIVARGGALDRAASVMYRPTGLDDVEHICQRCCHECSPRRSAMSPRTTKAPQMQGFR